MSGGTNNFTRTSRNWQVGYDYGVYSPDDSDRNRRQAPFSRFGSTSFRADPEHHPWQLFEQRGIRRPFSLTGFPVHSLSPVQIPILGSPSVRPRHRQIIQGSPPGSMNYQQNVHPTEENNSRSARGAQNTALKKLKKEIYNPPTKKLTRGLSLYFRDEAIKVYKEMEKQKENDAKRCAVCLEDFEPKEVVMLTPCSHMFHEDCIVPWVKSNAQCPVCRFSFGEKTRENASENNMANAAGDDLFARELMTVVRAMEDAFIWDPAIR